MEHTEDDDLARAIALSLQESQQAGADNDHEVLFQEQLRQAIEASQTSEIEAPTPTPTATISTSVFLSERSQLEKERRERQKRRRKAQGLPDSDDERQDGSDEEEDVGEPSAKRQRLSSSHGGPSNIRTSGSSSDSLFWNGELRPTATRGVEPRKDGKSTFRLTEVLGNRTEIAFAILSTFAEDNSWMYSFFDPSVPVIMVSQPGEDGKSSLKNIFPNWIRTAPFLKGGYGCMHMKFMLIFYKTGRLRVVISTANLIQYDWMAIENAVWLQDILPLSKPTVFNKSDTESFQYVMKRVLESINVVPALDIMIKQGHSNLPMQTTQDLCTLWDWSKVKVALVPSIAGKFEGWLNVIKTGHTRLMKALRNMSLDIGSRQKAELEYQGSSIGQYTTQWMNEFILSARGDHDSAKEWLNKTKNRRTQAPYPSGMKILYPTLATVRGSQYGEQGGGNLFCKRNQWEAKNFPRHLFYDSTSKAGRTLMHTKMAVCTFSKPKPSTVGGGGPSKREVINVDTDSETEDSSEDENDAADTSVGWAYVGSHNFTPSAWGTLSGSGFNPVLNIRNYELGIVFPFKDNDEVSRIACFERPPRKYGPDDSPWIAEEAFKASA